jgi:hypothetical protein
VVAEQVDVIGDAGRQWPYAKPELGGDRRDCLFHRPDLREALVFQI